MPNPKIPDTLDLRKIFLGLQGQMGAELMAHKSITHDVAAGAAAERSWLHMFKTYLPKRYQADKGFVLDSRGRYSHEIDIIIFDRHYSPFLFNQGGALYVPAESVYAVLEVRQRMRIDVIEYAGAKAATVRRLHRTTAPIPHAGGTYPAKKPFPILAGVVTLGSIWQKDYARHVLDAALRLTPEERIDLGCALRGGAFDVQYGPLKRLAPSICAPHLSPSNPQSEARKAAARHTAMRNPQSLTPARLAKRTGGRAPVQVTASAPGDALIAFFLTLLSRLQSLGTVPALDFTQYAKSLHPR